MPASVPDLELTEYGHRFVELSDQKKKKPVLIVNAFKLGVCLSSDLWMAVKMDQATYMLPDSPKFR